MAEFVRNDYLSSSDAETIDRGIAHARFLEDQRAQQRNMQAAMQQGSTANAGDAYGSVYSPMFYPQGGVVFPMGQRQMFGTGYVPAYPGVVGANDPVTTLVVSTPQVEDWSRMGDAIASKVYSSPDAATQLQNIYRTLGSGGGGGGGASRGDVMGPPAPGRTNRMPIYMGRGNIDFVLKDMVPGRQNVGYRNVAIYLPDGSIRLYNLDQVNSDPKMLEQFTLDITNSDGLTNPWYLIPEEDLPLFQYPNEMNPGDVSQTGVVPQVQSNTPQAQAQTQTTTPRTPSESSQMWEFFKRVMFGGMLDPLGLFKKPGDTNSGTTATRNMSATLQQGAKTPVPPNNQGVSVNAGDPNPRNVSMSLTPPPQDNTANVPVAQMENLPPDWTTISPENSHWIQQPDGSFINDVTNEKVTEDEIKEGIATQQIPSNIVFYRMSTPGAYSNSDYEVLGNYDK